MTNKLSLSMVLAVLALVVSVAAYVTPGQVARGGEAACSALAAAQDKAPNERSKAAIQSAIDKNCPDLNEPNCASDVGLDTNLFIGSCVDSGTSLFSFEPSPTCGGGSCYVSAAL